MWNLQQVFKGVGNTSNSLEYFFNVEDVIEARSQDLVANDGLG
jgi:hypothetical protein